MSKILNLGCGTSKITGVDNVDVDPLVKPDLVFDIKHVFPIEDATYDEVYLFHTIEHIEKRFHTQLFGEIRRVLKDDGKLTITYPEFYKIIQNWATNKNNERIFWENTIFGRQNYASDYHVCAIDTLDFRQFLTERGFEIKEFRPEPIEDFNSILIAGKGPISMTYEEVLFNEVFKK